MHALFLHTCIRCKTESRQQGYAFLCVASAAHFLFLGVYIMENELYKKMYYYLFNAVTDAIRADTKSETDEILKQAQIKTEDMYINFNDIDS